MKQKGISKWVFYGLATITMSAGLLSAGLRQDFNYKPIKSKENRTEYEVKSVLIETSTKTDMNGYLPVNNDLNYGKRKISKVAVTDTDGVKHYVESDYNKLNDFISNPIYNGDTIVEYGDGRTSQYEAIIHIPFLNKKTKVSEVARTVDRSKNDEKTPHADASIPYKESGTIQRHDVSIYQGKIVNRGAY